MTRDTDKRGVDTARSLDGHGTARKFSGT